MAAARSLNFKEKQFMGYTQYFRKKELTHDQKTWDEFLQDCKKVACRFKLQIPQSIQFITDDDKIIKGDIDIPIGDGMGEGKCPEFTNDHIWFNGVKKDSHETLHISRDDSDKFKMERMGDYYKDMWERDKSIFGFTKTAQKPYDLLVTATLTLYKHHFGEKVEVSGDGGPEGFQEGLDLVNETLGYSIAMNDIYPSDEEED